VQTHEADVPWARHSCAIFSGDFPSASHFHIVAQHKKLIFVGGLNEFISVNAKGPAGAQQIFSPQKAKAGKKFAS
jgi:hypothetical protein